MHDFSGLKIDENTKYFGTQLVRKLFENNQDPGAV